MDLDTLLRNDLTEEPEPQASSQAPVPPSSEENKEADAAIDGQKENDGVENGGEDGDEGEEGDESTDLPDVGKLREAAIQTFKELCRKFRRGALESQGFHINLVHAILGARVPIVKLNCFGLIEGRRRTIPCDVSYGMLLSLYNTQLLRAYGLIDPRFTLLGFEVKNWAKRIGVAGADRHFFSSYALIVMLVSYLQQVEPPVLPYLQQLETTSLPKRRASVQGHDCYFFFSLDDLKEAWPEAGSNNWSVGKLLMGFFRHYAKQKSYSHVIQIRARDHTVHKGVRGFRSSVTVQDPFDLAHNLTRSVTKPNFASFIKVIKQACASFDADPANFDLASLTPLPATENQRRGGTRNRGRGSRGRGRGDGRRGHGRGQSGGRGRRIWTAKA